MFNNIKSFINDSLIIKHIDDISYIVLLLLLFASIFLSSEMLGGLAVLFSFIIIFKMIFVKFEKYSFKNYEKALIIYFLLVTVSLFASSLFKLSLHGYIKTLIYILFFFSAGIFFKSNRNKILPTIFFIAFLMSYESIVAIIQNLKGIDEISGWQDMTNINPEQVVSRAYGTLKPYNPNLLAGYLLCGLSSFIYLILNNLKQGKKRYALIYSFLFLLSIIAIIDTGCRGAYLGFILFFPCLIISLIYYIHKKYGSLSNIKKRYKNIFLIGISALICFILIHPALINRFKSIFAFRSDSSISFRLNVYEAVWRMFLDNIFLGIGVGNQNFREIYGLYMKSGFDALGSYCVPLEIAVESGIFALIAFVVFIVLVIKKCIEYAKGDFPLEKRILALSVMLMILAVTGHGAFDTIWFRPQLQFLFWTYIAMLDRD